MNTSQLRVHHEDLKRGPRILQATCEYGGVVFPYAGDAEAGSLRMSEECASQSMSLAS